MGWEEAETREGTDVGYIAIKIRETNPNISIEDAEKQAKELVLYFQKKPDITNDAGLSQDKIDLINDIKKLDPKTIKAVRAALDLFLSKGNQ